MKVIKSKSEGEICMKKIISLIMTLVILFSCEATVSATGTEDTINYSTENSYQIIVNVTKKTTFTTQSFPEVECSDVLVASMEKTTEGYQYTLIIVYDENIDVAAEKEKIASNTLVISVSDNQYIDVFSTMKLSEETLCLKVGESKDITIKELNLVNENIVYGLIMTLDTAVYDMTNLETDMFSDYDVQEVLTFEEAIEEYGYDVAEYSEIGNGCVGIVCNGNKEECVEAVDKLLEAGVVESAMICQIAQLLGGAPPSEEWTIKDETIAGITLSGGVADEILSDVLKNQTATITGKKSGATKLKVYRCDNCMSVTTECEINVYLPGDTNLDNKANAEDALDILKVVANMTELEDLSTVAADINEDGNINAEDALEVLKVVAGL